MNQLHYTLRLPIRHNHNNFQSIRISSELLSRYCSTSNKSHIAEAISTSSNIDAEIGKEEFSASSGVSGTVTEFESDATTNPIRDQEHKEFVQFSPPSSKLVKQPSQPQKETIINRLIRLSQSTPEEFAPTARSREEIDAAKKRYEPILRDFNNRFYREEYLRRRNSNYRQRPNSNFHYDGGSGDSRARSWRGDNDRFGNYGRNYREFSTSAVFLQVNDNNGSEGIIERLKKLSVSSGKDYQPSDAAVKARNDSKSQRASSSRARDEDFDQRKFRPNQNPRQFQNRSFSPRNYQNHNEERGVRNYEERDGGSSSGFQRERRNSFNNNQTQDYYSREKRHEDRRNSWSGSDSRAYPRSNSSSYENNTFSHNDNNEDGGSYQRKFRREDPATTKLKQFGHNLDSPNKAQRTLKQRKESPADATNPSKPDAELDLSTILSQTDADTFGTLSLGPVPIKDYVGAALKTELMKDEHELGLSGIDDFEDDDMKILPEGEDRWSMNKLSNKIKDLVGQMKVKEAVDTLMSALNQGGFQFDAYKLRYIYNLCIASCAQVGYVKMSFKLFTDMKKRGIIPRDSTYTSLFNACSNSTWDAENNIDRMNRLRESMLEKGIPANQIIYHAMIKGYGRNGDIESAFGVVDEMMQGNVAPNTETFNMLFQACITNTDNGFRHVLVTWRKMHDMRIRPDIYTYNLLLRAVRECGILADPELLLEQEKQKHDQSKEIVKGQETAPILLHPLITEEDSNNMLNLLCLNKPEALENINQHPDYLASGRKLSYKDLIQALQDPTNRLSIFGGLRGIMSQMANDKVGPNLKTVTELGQSIPSTDIGDLIMLMKTFKLKPDITFFNLMIKRCYDSGNGHSARKLTAGLGQFGLSPNILTWGVAATACGNQDMAEKLLLEMENAKFTPNIQIMGAFLGRAAQSFNPKYVLWTMEETLKREIEPETRFVLQVEEFKHLVKKGIIDKELGKPVSPLKLQTALEDMDKFEKSWKIFLFRYESWMKTTKIQIEPKDPWEQDFETFQQNKSHGTLNSVEDGVSYATENPQEKLVDAKISS